MLSCICLRLCCRLSHTSRHPCKFLPVHCHRVSPDSCVQQTLEEEQRACRAGRAFHTWFCVTGRASSVGWPLRARVSQPQRPPCPGSVGRAPPWHVVLCPSAADPHLAACCVCSSDSLGWKLFYVTGCLFVAVQNLEDWEVRQHRRGREGAVGIRIM